MPAGLFARLCPVPGKAVTFSGSRRCRAVEDFVLRQQRFTGRSTLPIRLLVRQLSPWIWLATNCPPAPANLLAAPKSA